MKAMLLAASLALAGCSVAPIAQTPKPTAFILIGDCSNIAFAMAVDCSGHVAITGGNATTTEADKDLLLRAHAHATDPDVHNINIHVGDCQND